MGQERTLPSFLMVGPGGASVNDNKRGSWY
jgi:hypothetical protein